MGSECVVLDIILNPELSAQSVRKNVGSYFEKFASKVSKGSALTASDAKKEGPTIIKLVNSCLKQVLYRKFC